MNFSFIIKKKNFIILNLIIFMAILGYANIIWAGNVFIDPTANSGGNGSFSAPFNSWANVTFRASNDYYQKCGTKTVLNSDIYVNANGTQTNKIVIGPYYNDGGVPALRLSSADAKPIIDRGTKTEGAVFYINGDYITIVNLELRRGEASVRIKGANNIVEYCVIGEDAKWGIRVAGIAAVNNIIRNNIIDTKSDVYNPYEGGENKNSLDGIAMVSGSTNTHIYRNFFGAWDHTAFEIENSNHNEIYDNTATNPTSLNMRFFAIDLGSSYNKIYNNWVENMDAHSQFGAGVHNEAYKNVFYTMTDNHDEGQGACIWFQGIAGGNSKYNKVYNNIIYNVQREGVVFYNNPGNGVVQDNKVFKNVIVNTGLSGLPQIFVDKSTDGILNQEITDNIIFNDNGEDQIKYRGSFYSTADFNSVGLYDIIENNQYKDPKLKDPENGNFSFESNSSLLSAGIEEIQVNIITYNELLNAGVSKLMPPTLRIVKQ